MAQKQNIQLQLAQAYQRRGEHSAALETLKLIKIDGQHQNSQIVSGIKFCTAVSYCALGLYQESCDIFDEVLRELVLPDINSSVKGSIFLEAGKAFFSNHNNDRAQECWQEAIKLFEGSDDDLDQYIRAKANLGFTLLRNPTEAEQEKGVRIIEECSILKENIGDIQGLATNYSQLGRYYWRKKRYERAIAYTRIDLHLSRRIGNLREIASTLCNLAEIYIDLKQLNSARQRLREAKQIAEILKDGLLIMYVDKLSAKATEVGREAGQKGEKVGPAAYCGCGSNRKYQKCCGQADFEPIDNPLQFAGFSEDLIQNVKEMKIAGVEPSRLDLILRHSDEAKKRLAWQRVEVHDGWIKISELPDMANYHLSSAKILAEEIRSEPNDSIVKPLSCVILSVCALEAFINHVSFFINEVMAFSDAKFTYAFPSEITTNVLEFQRRTELTQKWDILGKELCGEGWPPPDSLWTDFRNLIYVRNELVHFKSGEYEQVDPMPKQPHDVMIHVPNSVETRKIPHSWPARLLTASYATHCINVAESMIEYFKKSYREARLLAAKNN